MNEIIRILNRTDGGLVLDAATGRGEFITILKQHLKSFTQIIGVDFSERSVSYAEKLFPENDVEIFKMNLENLQFEDEYFDLVCISNSLHHLERPEMVIRELMRVLKFDGRLLITEMYSDGEQTPAQQTHILMHHWIAEVDMQTGIFHKSTFSKAELDSFAKSLTLDKLEILDFYVPVDNPVKNCESLIRNCKDTIKRLESIPGSEELIATGQKMLSRISEIGCASASRVVITGLKPRDHNTSKEK